MAKKEKDVWQHYTDYLKEATRMPDSELSPLIGDMRKKVQSGCSRQELKELMLAAFEPITIMQGLEQWQNQMDLLMDTGLDQYNGLSRNEHGKRLNKNPYDMVDGVLDPPYPDTHIYELSSTTQDLAHMASEHGGRESPNLMKQILESAHLESNWELTMLLGDCYRQNGKFDKALETYERIKIGNRYPDPSVQEAISFTKYIQENGCAFPKMSVESIMNGFQKYKNNGTVRRAGAKIGRNDPCPCGSGKKYKYCCGRK